MLDVHRLRVFRAVVTSGSVNKAAANLGYTPSAVSQQVNTLQRETGLPLTERHGRGIEITAAGRLLAEEASAVLEQLAVLDSVVADLRAKRLSSLSVASFASAGAAWIPPVVAALTSEFPDIRVDLRLHELAGEQRTPPDIQVYVEDAAQQDPRGYDVHPLLTEPYVVVVPDHHRLVGWPTVPLRELAEESWVDNDFSRGPCRRVVIDACSSLGFSPAFRVETQDYPTAISFVAAGVGITVLPRLGVGSLPSGLVAIPVVDPMPQRRIAVRVREALRDHPAAHRFVELLRARVA